MKYILSDGIQMILKSPKNNKKSNEVPGLRAGISSYTRDIFC